MALSLKSHHVCRIPLLVTGTGSLENRVGAKWRISTLGLGGVMGTFPSPNSPERDRMSAQASELLRD